MTLRTWGEEFRNTTVCVDSYENGVLRGRFYNPGREEGTNFESTTQFLLGMEKTLDDMDFPKAFTVSRTFQSVPDQPSETAEPDEKIGRAATFAIRILFRQNASWQGSVTWLEGRMAQSFRSVLELIMLLDNALSCVPTS